ncbi:MAG: FecR domain-containing protein [Niabella sp.]
MTKDAFKDILIKYLEGTASPLEAAYVEKWYESVPELEEHSATSLEEIGEEIYKRIREKIEPAKRSRSFSTRWAYGMAAVLALAVAGSLFYYYGFGTKRQERVASTLLPGSEKALLKLADGSVIALDSTGFGNVAADGGAEIIKMQDGTLAYKTLEEGGSEEAVRYNEMQIPAGGSYKLRLPDGSMVWLNSVSSIKFPTKFTGKERRVFIKGEAYFEVAHDKSKPFIVEVPGKQEAAVLGTHFNMSAYEGEGVVKTTLLEGSIKVNTPGIAKAVVLKPGQQSVVKAGKTIETRDGVDVEQVMAWKNGFFIFKETDISEIMKQISRWYNADIELDPKLQGQTFSGKIPRKDDVEKLLKMFETTNTVRFDVQGNKIRVYPRR